MEPEPEPGPRLVPAGRRLVPAGRRRALIAAQTRLRPVPGVPGIRLHLADAVEPVWTAIAAAAGGRRQRQVAGTAGDRHDRADRRGAADEPIPFWAFAWAGGLALARHLLEHPEIVRARSVADVASGSGLVAIAAARAGAASVTAIDIDPFAEIAARLNARANDVAIEVVRADAFAGPPPPADVVLVADTWYEGPLAERVLPWLRSAVAAGRDVLIGDPGRRYLPLDAFEAVAEYDVETTTELEDRAIVRGRVFRLRA
jgi:predicted nicotinamide N-methyase